MTCLSKLSLSLTAQWICSIHTNEKGGMISNDKNEERFIQKCETKINHEIRKEQQKRFIPMEHLWYEI